MSDECLVSLPTTSELNSVAKSETNCVEEETIGTEEQPRWIINRIRPGAWKVPVLMVVTDAS